MKQTPDSRTYNIVFFIIGIVFLLLGFTTPIFIAVGAALVVIGLVGVMRKRQKEGDKAQDGEQAEPTDEMYSEED